MGQAVQTSSNLTRAVPFFLVSNMNNSLKFYVDGLGFEMTNKWIPRGTIEWCYLRRGGADLMLQELRSDENQLRTMPAQPAAGVSICFMCEDAIALYHEFINKGLKVSEPFVGNGMWVISLSDTDGYRLDFESYTEVAEETTFSQWRLNQ